MTFHPNSWLSLCLFFLVLQASAQNTVGLINHSEDAFQEGYLLFAPMASDETYMINSCGEKVSVWPGTYRPALSAYLLEDGSLLRTGNLSNADFQAGGSGGIIERYNAEGLLTWTYTISDSQHCMHHDICPLPNGHVLVIAWEAKSALEAQEAGRDPQQCPDTVWSEMILELAPISDNEASVVWEWHLWDHLVQNYSPSLPNYGEPFDHPESVDINFEASAQNADWIHLNAIDYHAEHDQILLSSHNFSEIWIIDHSTTIAEAAGHSGGNAGRGGDFLYRWGNPRAYGQGDMGDQKLFGQHDAQWISEGLPNAGEVLIFNNGNGRPGGNYSTVDRILLPWNGQAFDPALPYAPASATVVYNAGNTNDFYAANISGVEPLSNGHYLICSGPDGRFLEISEAGEIVWEYINPVTNSGVLAQGMNPDMNPVFRADYYAYDFPGCQALDPQSDGIVEDVNLLSDKCNTSMITDEIGAIQSRLVLANPVHDSMRFADDIVLQSGSRVGFYDISGRMVMSWSAEEVMRESSLNLPMLDGGSYLVMCISASGLRMHQVIVVER